MDQLVDHADLPELASGSWWSAFWEGFHPGDRRVEMQLLQQDGRLLAAFRCAPTGGWCAGGWGWRTSTPPTGRRPSIRGRWRATRRWRARCWTG